MQITRKSVISGIQRTFDIPVDPEHFVAWQSGLGNIQDLMPYLSADHREFILSGITPEEWNDAFSETEESECI
jgi:hypothetical protein